jgi:hypothetical protein
VNRGLEGEDCVATKEFRFDLGKKFQSLFFSLTVSEVVTLELLACEDVQGRMGAFTDNALRHILSPGNLLGKGEAEPLYGYLRWQIPRSAEIILSRSEISPSVDMPHSYSCHTVRTK